MKELLTYKALINNLSVYMDKLDNEISPAMNGFSTLAKGAMKKGVLAPKTKELIALSISITSHVHGCIAFHTKSLVELGVTREEFLEALAITIYMGGGTNMMYAADALQAYDELCSVK